MRTKCKWGIYCIVTSLLLMQWNGMAHGGILDGTFELEGDATNNTAIAGDDWSSLFPSLTSSTVLAKVFVIDQPPDQTVFTTGGSKDYLDISNWRQGAGSSADKAEITDAYAALYQQGTDLFLVFGADRYGNSGSVNVGFWFFQNAVAPITSGVDAGKFSGAHTTNDLLIVSEFTVGGSVSTINVYRWVGAGGSDGALDLISSGADCKTATATGLMCATVNTVETPSPWPYVPKAGTPNKFPIGCFFEGTVNISQLVPGNVCFASFLAETRSSAKTSAVLQDFAIGRLGTCCIDLSKTAAAAELCGSGDVSYNFVASNCGAFDLSNARLVDDNGTPNTNDDVTITFSVTHPGDTFTTNLVFSVSGSGPFTNTATATAKHGAVTVTSSDSAVVLVHPLPACTITGKTPISCQGETSSFCATNLTGATYAWSGPGGFSATARCTGPISTAGTYTVTITDTNGCASTCSRELVVNQPPSSSVSPASTNICNGSSAQFCANVSAGVAPYSFAWSNGSTNQCINASAAGTYSVTVTDSKGCTATSSGTLALRDNTAASTPGDQMVCKSATANFSTTASGTGPFSYQWKLDGSDIAGATNSTVVIDTTSLTAGNHPVAVGVNGTCGSITKSATLTVQANTDASTPGNQTVCKGSTANFSTTASGPGPFSYQWKLDGSDIAGATNSTVAIDTTSLTVGNHPVAVAVNGTCGSITKSATLTVQVNTDASTPGNQTVCKGSTANFSTTASGPGPFSYQWKLDGSDIAGATNNTVTIDTTSLTVGNHPVAVAVNGTCGATSKSATLTVQANTDASTPGNQTVCKGSTANFSTTASGPGPFSYQWKLDGSDIAGATNNTVAIDTASLTVGNHPVAVAVSGTCGATSKSATLTVQTNTDASSLTDQEVCTGATAGFSTTPSGTGPFTFQWSLDGTNILAATNTTVTIETGPLSAGAHSVRVLVNGACGSASKGGTLTVNALPACSMSIELCATNSPGLSYLWSGPDQNGATNRCIAVKTAGTYTVLITDEKGCTNSCQRAVQ